MKKILVIIISSAIGFSATENNAMAQASSRNLMFSNLRNVSAVASYVDANGGSATIDPTTKENLKSAKTDYNSAKETLKATKAGFKATESFQRRFKNAKNVSWQNYGDAIVATYSTNDVNSMVVYDSKGRYIHAIDYMPAASLPSDVQKVLQSDFPGYNVLVAAQIEEKGMTFYMLQLLNGNSNKRIWIYNGESGIVEEFTQQ